MCIHTNNEQVEFVNISVRVEVWNQGLNGFNVLFQSSSSLWNSVGYSVGYVFVTMDSQRMMKWLNICVEWKCEIH